MDIEWGKFETRAEKVVEIAEEKFPEEEFHLNITAWNTGNFEIEAKHGITNTSREEAVLMDEDGNIVFERRKREFESREKEIIEAEMIESSEDIDYRGWQKKKMSE